MTEVLSRRALNRGTLARQLLLEGATLSVRHAAGVDRAARNALEDEGARFLRFLDVAAGDVRLSRLS